MYKDEKGRSLTEASHSMVAAFFMSGKQDYLKMLNRRVAKAIRRYKISNLLKISFCIIAQAMSETRKGDTRIPSSKKGGEAAT